MYQLLIFDWDGTLMDSAQKIANCIQASARDLDLPEPSDADAKHIIGLGLTEAMQLLFPQASQHTVAKLVQAYREHWLGKDTTSQALFKGVLEGLSQLESQQVMLAIATGKSRAGLDRAYQELNIAHLFTTSRCADETRSKPHPQMLMEILEFTAISPQNTLMIGDTTYDMEMARNAGVDALGVAYGVHTKKALSDSGAVDVVDSFAELMAWLSKDRIEAAFS